MSARYRLDPGPSRFTVQAFAARLLSFAAHSPTFAVRDFAGELRWRPDADDGAGLDLTVPAGALGLVNNVRPADRAEIEGRMRQEVLEVGRYPDIRFQAAELLTTPRAESRYLLRLAGRLALHGVTRGEVIEADLLAYDDGVRLGGAFPLRLSDYRIRPVTALAGAIRLQDQLRLAFDLVAWKEAS